MEEVGCGAQLRELPCLAHISEVEYGAAFSGAKWDGLLPTRGVGARSRASRRLQTVSFVSACADPERCNTEMAVLELFAASCHAHV